MVVTINCHDPINTMKIRHNGVENKKNWDLGWLDYFEKLYGFNDSVVLYFFEFRGRYVVIQGINFLVNKVVVLWVIRFPLDYEILSKR